MLIVFSKIMSIFLMILIGFIANKRNLLSDDAIPHMTNLMMYITAPCMVMGSIYSKTLSSDVITSTVQILIGSAVYFTAMTLLAFLFVKLLKFKPKEDWGMYMIALVTVNSGFMGFPVTKAIFGNDIFYLMVIGNIILNFYMFCVAPPILNIGSKVTMSFGEMLKTMVNIVFIAIIAGIVMLVLGVKPPAFIDDMVQAVGDATIPVSMLLVGMQLGSSHILSVLKNKRYLVINITAMVVIPLLTFLAVNPMNFLDTDVKVILIFTSAFPTAVASVAICDQYGKNAKGMAEIVSLTTFTSLITVPLIAAFLMSYYY